MNCPECGFEVPEGGRYCSRCGATIEAAAPLPAAPESTNGRAGAATAQLPRSDQRATVQTDRFAAPTTVVPPPPAAHDTVRLPGSGEPPAPAGSATRTIPMPSAFARTDCSACGAPLQPDARFCNGCGAIAAPLAAAPQTLIEPVVSPAGRRRWMLPAIVGTALAAALIGGFCIVSVMQGGGSTPSSGTTATATPAEGLGGLGGTGTRTPTTAPTTALTPGATATVIAPTEPATVPATTAPTVAPTIAGTTPLPTVKPPLSTPIPTAVPTFAPTATPTQPPPTPTPVAGPDGTLSDFYWWVNDATQGSVDQYSATAAGFCIGFYSRGVGAGTGQELVYVDGALWSNVTITDRDIPVGKWYHCSKKPVPAGYYVAEYWFAGVLIGRTSATIW